MGVGELAEVALADEVRLLKRRQGVGKTRWGRGEMGAVRWVEVVGGTDVVGLPELLRDRRELQRHEVRAHRGLRTREVHGKSSREEGAPRRRAPCAQPGET